MSFNYIEDVFFTISDDIEKFENNIKIGDTVVAIRGDILPLMRKKQLGNFKYVSASKCLDYLNMIYVGSGDFSLYEAENEEILTNTDIPISEYHKYECRHKNDWLYYSDTKKYYIFEAIRSHEDVIWGDAPVDVLVVNEKNRFHDSWYATACRLDTIAWNKINWDHMIPIGDFKPHVLKKIIKGDFQTWEHQFPRFKCAIKTKIATQIMTWMLIHDYHGHIKRCLWEYIVERQKYLP